VVVGRLQERTWTAEDGSARSVVEVLAEELAPSYLVLISGMDRGLHWTRILDPPCARSG
jgi:single-stranded DNA-binding protein